MKTIFVAGHAKLPGGMAANHISESLTLTLEIDRKYGVIIDASCTLATDHGREYIKSLLKGYSLKDGTEEPVASLREGYLGKAGNALEAALKDSYKQYQLHH
ncbi:DUF3870 domain-containing protein [Halobacillus sp. ACCC02827]|uniref:DUF3870 domain-containing protein n=1 Tax=Bacillaceae TaxID=186817 RepID=UPI0002A50C7C|nr:MULTISPECIES: DUF3870 domain-containing protein [Bacillaceae]ELK47910.1 hypothetical protein D479_04640 [Halobacillus sp. BAB-2008]QHT47733.1 DUF3870 domain-containing protein [Bacillus sp. SB49]WJE14973.1 DUF3870 domain-containing protein [Halobacillus sp. ACCC02827]